MKWTENQFKQVASLRAEGVQWKRISKIIGDGIQNAYYYHRHPELIKEKRKAKPAIAKIEIIQLYFSVISTNERRARILCNAWFGLDLFSGLQSTRTEKRLTTCCIRLLQSRGFLNGLTVAKNGAILLTNLTVKQ